VQLQNLSSLASKLCEDVEVASKQTDGPINMHSTNYWSNEKSNTPLAFALQREDKFTQQTFKFSQIPKKTKL